MLGEKGRSLGDFFLIKAQEPAPWHASTGGGSPLRRKKDRKTGSAEGEGKKLMSGRGKKRAGPGKPDLYRGLNRGRRRKLFGAIRP